MNGQSMSGGRGSEQTVNAEDEATAVRRKGVKKEKYPNNPQVLQVDCILPHDSRFAQERDQVPKAPEVEPLTPDQTREEQIHHILRGLERRKTAEQRMSEDEDVQALQAALEMQRDQRLRLSLDMSTLASMSATLKSDRWFAIRYLYALGQGKLSAPESIKRHFLKLYLDIVIEARKREKKGEALSVTEQYLLYGPSHGPNATCLAHGGAVAGPSSSTDPDGPSSIASPHSQKLLPTEPRLPRTMPAALLATDFSDCTDWPGPRGPAVKTPSVDWSRFRVCGEPLDRIRNIVLASYDRPELLDMLDEDEARWQSNVAVAAEARRADV